MQIMFNFIKKIIYAKKGVGGYVSQYHQKPVKKPPEDIDKAASLFPAAGKEWKKHYGYFCEISSPNGGMSQPTFVAYKPENEMSEWVKCSDRMPLPEADPRNGLVYTGLGDLFRSEVVFVGINNQVFRARLVKTTKTFHWKIFNYELDERLGYPVIEYWMPIPELPKGE